MVMEQTTRLCRLEAAVGKAEECPEDACPFWEPGGAALNARCAVEELGVAADADLARWLLEIRGSWQPRAPLTSSGRCAAFSTSS